MLQRVTKIGLKSLVFCKSDNALDICFICVRYMISLGNLRTHSNALTEEEGDWNLRLEWISIPCVTGLISNLTRHLSKLKFNLISLRILCFFGGLRQLMRTSRIPVASRSKDLSLQCVGKIFEVFLGSLDAVSCVTRSVPLGLCFTRAESHKGSRVAWKRKLPWDRASTVICFNLIRTSE